MTNENRDLGGIPGTHVSGSSKALRTRMVPAGTHFAPAPDASSDAAGAVPDARPAGRRFAAPREVDADRVPMPPRPAGARFSAAPTAEGAGSADGAASPRPAGARFSSGATASAMGGQAGPRPAGKRFAAPAAGEGRAVQVAPSTREPREPRRQGRRFAAPASGTDDALSGPQGIEEVPRPAGRRFASHAPAQAASQAGPARADEPKRPGTRFAQVAPSAPADPAAPSPAKRGAEPTPADTFAALNASAFGGLSPDGSHGPSTASEPEPDAAVTSAIPAQPAAAPVGSSAISGATAVSPAVPASARDGRPTAAAGTHAMSSRAAEAVAARADRHRASKISIALIAIGVILLLVAAGMFIATQIGYREAQETYSDLQQYAVSSDEGDGVPSVDFDALAAINPDVVGWIYIPGTMVNYPVVQTDDNSTYLSRLFDGSGNGSGTIFMDMDDTAPGLINQQTTIYGHHMNDGSMFKVIDNTIDQGEFDRIGSVYYITRDTTYVLRPLFTAQVEDTYTAARQPNFTGEGESLTSYLEDLYTHMRAEAPDARERIQSADRVVSLVTCAGEIIPRTTRAVMVLTVEEQTLRQ